MANKFIILLLIVSVASGGFLGVRALTKNPCTVAKTWSLGPVDSRFGLSEKKVKEYATEAALVWNNAYKDNPLLEHKEAGGDITITLVYDERQRTTIQNERLKRTIEEEKGELTDIKRTIESLRDEYNTLGSSISARTESYNIALSKHNKEVSYWNQKGGAPNDIYQRLQREAATLETERASINASVARYNQLATTIRQYGREHNEIVGDINEKISTINESAEQEFEEGTYDPNTETITIYEYGSTDALKRVFIHEFGHALSLGHVEDKNAIMYPINQGKTLTLSEADKQELGDVCREKTLDDLVNVAKIIRDDIVRLAGWSLTDKAVQAE